RRYGSEITAAVTAMVPSPSANPASAPASPPVQRSLAIPITTARLVDIDSMNPAVPADACAGDAAAASVSAARDADTVTAIATHPSTGIGGQRHPATQQAASGTSARGTHGTRLPGCASGKITPTAASTATSTRLIATMPVTSAARAVS